jgi:hypothetical protein
MGQVLGFPEKLMTFAASQKQLPIEFGQIDLQLSDLRAKLSGLKIGPSNRDHAVATFIIAVALSHAQSALQLISDSSWKHQFEDKLRETRELLQAVTVKDTETSQDTVGDKTVGPLKD